MSRDTPTDVRAEIDRLREEEILVRARSSLQRAQTEAAELNQSALRKCLRAATPFLIGILVIIFALGLGSAFAMFLHWMLTH